MMESSCGDTDKTPPVQMHRLREFEQHLNDLKKENFSLKLRIYFLEERIQQKFEESGEDVHKRNIELKVEVESLKNELDEKQQLLDKALSTAESLSNHSEAELQRRLSERQEEISHMQEILEAKVQLLQEEARLARDEAHRMSCLADTEARRRLELERDMLERTEGSGGDRDRLVEELKEENRSLAQQVDQLEATVHQMSSSLQHGEAGGRRPDSDNHGSECGGELQEARDRVRESESRNRELQERLGAAELELRSAREEAQRQGRSLQGLSDTIRTKEAEAVELYRVIEEQNNMLCSFKDLANRNQLQQLQVSGTESLRGHGEILGLQASLFQAQLELQAGQRARRQAARAQEDLSRALQRLEKDLQEALQHRRDTEGHNQELQLALDEARSALREREERLSDSERERRKEDEQREKTIRELRRSLKSKEQLVEDYCELLDEPSETRDALIQKLRQRIKERDGALERAVDEKFRCVEEKEEETRRLRLLLREKERDLERQRCALANNEETIASLEVLVRGKGLELQQAADAWRSVQQQRRDGEERQNRALGERDAVIVQLQGALQACTQEAQELRCSLLTRTSSPPGGVLEELKVRLQLKDQLFQEVLADRTRQAQEHQDQVTELLRTIGARDQYIQDSAARLGEVMSEQAGRLQELRRQLTSGPDSAEELRVLREELRLVLRREKENQELSRGRDARLEALQRTLLAKEEAVKDFQRQLSDPAALPLVERLTLEIQDLRERLLQQDGPPARGPVLGRDRVGGRHPECGDLTSEDGDEDLNTDDTFSIDEEERSSARAGGYEGPEPPSGGRRLVEQKRVVERQLGELKAQLEKAGFSSLSQMRKALLSLRQENEGLKHQLTDGGQSDGQTPLEDEDEEEEELDVTIEGVEEDEEEEEEVSELWDSWDGALALSVQKHCPKNLQDLDIRDLLAKSSPDARGGAQRDGAPDKAVRLQQQSRALKERLMVSEATVQAQAEQLKDYRDLLTETTVQQDSKQIQVDLQDLGYETCGRSENEAEREDTSSPEFDDLEMCTSLDCGSQWWPTNGGGGGSAFAEPAATAAATQISGYGDEASSLQRLVEDLRSQLSRSQAVIRGLQSRLRSLSTSSDCGPSTPRKVNWSFRASPSQSGAEDDEGWQSSDGGPLASPRHPQPDKGLRELVSRVDALEDQMRKGGKKSAVEDGKSAIRPGKFDTLIQAQARELSHLRQRLREGRGVSHILTQHLGDTTKAFEELLRANDIDYYMGQSFRDQLAQSSALAQRVSAKITGRDQPEDPDDKTELLAIRLSRELQQKDKVIESLRAKLNQSRQQAPRPATPCGGRALSETTDQSDRISYVSGEHGSANEDLELGSDAGSEMGREDASGQAGTDCHSVASSHRTLSCLSCPAVRRPASPLHADGPTAPAPFQRRPSPPPRAPRARYQGNGGAGFSLAEVQRELQMLQRQLADSRDRFSTPQSKPLQSFPLMSHRQPDPPGFLPLSFHSYQPSPYGGGLDAGSALKAGAGLLESGALWDVSYGAGPARAGAELSSGSSGYQSGTSHTGSDLMKEHLKEIRGLRERLEDSIHTNDRLRQQLEDRLSRPAAEKGAPTNIYIQGLDSVGQLSGEIRLLKEENVGLQNQLRNATREGGKEAERLREAALLERARLKEAELEAEKWAEQSRKLRGEADERSREIGRLRQDRLRQQDAVNRLRHEVSVLQQQLSESRGLACSLQEELQRVRRPVPPGLGTATFDPGELRTQLEQQLSGPAEPRTATRRLFHDNVPSPPVRDTGLLSPSSPLHHAHDAAEPDADGLHAVGHLEKFKALQLQVLEGRAVLRSLEAELSSLNASRKDLTSVSVGKLLVDASRLRRVLDEADSLMGTFWRASPPDAADPEREELELLRLRLSQREEALRDAAERLKTSNLSRDGMERFIVSQLSRTRDVLRRAKTNLQVKAAEAPVASPSLLVGVS